MLNKYDLWDYYAAYITDGSFPAKNVWKKLVKDNVNDSNERKLRNNLNSSLRSCMATDYMYMYTLYGYGKMKFLQMQNQAPGCWGRSVTKDLNLQKDSQR